MQCANLDVFVLTYNRADCLYIMLESLCLQTATGFKIKIVNNCSTDNTLEVIEKIKSKYPERNIETITHTKNIGNFGNFKYTQEIAENEYTAIFHDDDAIHPEYIETAMNIFRDNKDVVMCSGNLQWLWNVSNNDWGVLYKDYYKYTKRDGVYFNLLISRPTFAVNIYLTKAYRKIHYHPQKYGKLHDIIFMLELNRIGSVAFILGACIRWRQSVFNDSNTLSSGPFPREIINVVKRISELNFEHHFLWKTLLWNFSYFLYKWGDLKRFLSWEQFEKELIKENIFTEFEKRCFHKPFIINNLNKMIKKVARYNIKKIYCKYDSRFSL